MTERLDALVLGAGVNGLVAALRLAGAGWRVAVIDRRETVGGLAAGEELAGGRVASVLDDTAPFREWIADALDLRAGGLERVDAGEPIFCPGEGRGLVLDPDPDGALAEVAAQSDGDVGGWRARSRFLDRVGPAVRRLLDTPPPPLEPTIADLPELARTAWALRRLGGPSVAELLRVLPMSVADWLREGLASPLLVEALAAPGVVGTWLGPHAAGTAALAMFHEVTAGRPVRGGAPALVDALATACRGRGVELRVGDGAASILVGDDRAVTVRTTTGDEIEARTVLASGSPRTALLRLLPCGCLPLALEEGLRAFRCRGTTARLQLAIRGTVEWSGRPGESFPRVRIGGGHVDALERAADGVKYRRLPARPHLELRLAGDPMGGVTRLSALVSFVPYTLEGGWTQGARQTLAERCLEALGRHAPGIADRVTEMRLMTPPDLEEAHGLPGGQIHHGEHALDQLLFLRPTPELCRYRTPIPGLYLAGSGCHPGGGLSGVPGWLGAGAALEDARA